MLRGLAGFGLHVGHKYDEDITIASSGVDRKVSFRGDVIGEKPSQPRRDSVRTRHVNIR